MLPPSLRDWLPAGHLVWTVLAAVEEMDLSGFYGAYRADGHGRAAYDPAMMVVALLLYSYARGNRSSRAIERERVEDVAYRVICANLVPDHSTIADFRKRHEAALSGLFGEVLAVCREAGLVTVGVIAVDSMKVHANASRFSSLDYEQLARKILEEADRIDREEDELYGDARGDELPEQLQTPEGRREALREAKRRLAESAGGDQRADGSAEPSSDAIELDRAAMVGHKQARRGWMREARHQLDEHRRQQAKPIPRSRAARLLEAERRMQQDAAVERAASDGYDAWRAARVAGGVKGNRVGGPTKPYEPPEEPAGKINVTDLDSRNVKSPRGWVQGYSAQAVVNENHIVIAAEVTIDSPDFGHLEPMVAAAERELEAIGVSERPQVALADAGYWHQVQMQNIAARGTQVLVPPDASKRTDTRPGWNDGMYAFMRRVLESELGRQLYRRRQAIVEPVFADTKFNRRLERFQRRGRSAVSSEWRLVHASHNLLKLHRHQLAIAGA